MAWVKQQKVKQDFYLAKDDLNQMQTNGGDMHDTLLAAEHENNINAKSSYIPFGAHKHKRFAKATARLGVWTSGDYANVWLDWGTGIYGFVTRESVGRYRVQVRTMDSDSTYPFSFTPAETDGTALRDILAAYENGGSNNNTFVGFVLTLLQWDSGAGSWELADFDFGISAFSIK